MSIEISQETYCHLVQPYLSQPLHFLSTNYSKGLCLSQQLTCLLETFWILGIYPQLALSKLLQNKFSNIHPYKILPPPPKKNIPPTKPKSNKYQSKKYILPSQKNYFTIYKYWEAALVLHHPKYVQPSPPPTY